MASLVRFSGKLPVGSRILGGGGRSSPFLKVNSTYRKPLPLPIRARWAPEDIATSATTNQIWQDSSGNGYQAYANGPQLATGLGGFNALGANGTKLTLSPITPMNSLTSCSFFAVVKTPVTPANLMAVFGMSEFNGSGTNKLDLELNSGSYPCQFVMRLDTLTVNDQTSLTAASSVAASTWYTVYGYYDGANTGLYLNGVLSGTQATITGTMRTALNFFLLGTNNAGPTFTWGVGGLLQELIFWGKSLVAVERQMVFDYSKDKYGI